MAKLRFFTTAFVLVLYSINPVLSEFKVKLEPEEFLNKKTSDNLLSRCLVETERSEGEEVSLMWVKVNGATETEIPQNGRVRSSLANTAQENGLDLIIMGAQKEDEGTYKCIGTMGEESDEQTILVKLYTKITFVNCPTTQNPTAGEDAIIECKVEADPPPGGIIWSKDGLTVNDENMDRENGYEFLEENMKLKLPHYDPDIDDGKYTIQVMQPQSGDIQTREINVAGRVAPKIEHFPGAEVRGYEGKDLDLFCAGTGRPEPKYLWYKGDESDVLLKTGDKYSVSTNGKLTIFSLTAEDEVKFVCVAENVVGKDQKTTEVDVYMKPRIDPIDNITKSKGDDLEISCEYSGDGIQDGDMLVEWISAGRSLGRSDAKESEFMDETRVYTVSKLDEAVLTLYINFVTLADAAEYQCVAKNEAGEAVRRVFLSVEHAPIFVGKTKTVRALKLTEIELFCEVTAVPTPNWEWTNPIGTAVESGEKYQLTTSNDASVSTIKITLGEDASDFGDYQCSADNGVGEPVIETIKVILVSEPLEPSGMRCEGQSPNSLIIAVDSLADSVGEGYEAVDIVFYFAKKEEVPADDGEEFWRNSATQVPLKVYDGVTYISKFKIPALTPKTAYQIKAEAKNEAGTSNLSGIVDCATSEAKAPKAPQFVPAADSEIECEGVCELRWEEPDNQGKDVTAFILEYFPVSTEGEAIGGREVLRLSAHMRSFQFEDLRPNTLYQIELKAENEIGQGEPASVRIKTGAVVLGGGVSPGAIVAIVLLIIIIVLVLVDVTCYYVHNCGVLMCLCINLCNKTPPDTKQKEVQMEEARNGDKAPLNQTPEQEEKGGEDTPLTDPQKEKHTTV